MISVVVPVRDEERTVDPLYEQLVAALEGRASRGRSCSSTTGRATGRTPRSSGSTTAPNVKVVRLRRNAGKAAALDAGFREVEGDIVVTIDGDLQDDPAEIPRLLAKLDEGYDLVTGWKTHRNDPFARRVLSRVFNTVTGWLSGLRLHDMNCGLKAFRVEVARELDLYGELHRFIPVLAHDLGFRVTEIAGQPPAARARPQPLRDGALRARLPRPADRHVHGPLPAPAAAPVRRARARARRRSAPRSSSTSRS